MQTSEEKVYIQTLYYLAQADGTVSKEELNAIHAIAEKFGLSAEETAQAIEEVKQGVKLTDILGKLEKRQTKLSLLYELVCICYADGVYAAEERKTITEIAQAMEIEESKVSDIEKLVEDYLALKERHADVLEIGCHM